MEITRVAQRRELLIEQIRSAFAGVGREGGVSLHEADVIDNMGSKHERDAARKLDTDHVWWDVPEADIKRYSWILCFLDPVGFRYYLPAYMTWTIKHYEHADSDSPDFTISVLEIATANFSLLNRAQSETVCAFLRFMVEETVYTGDDIEPRRALERYWGQFCR